MKKCIKCGISHDKKHYYYNWNVCNFCKIKQAKLRDNSIGSKNWIREKYYKTKGHAKRRGKTFSLSRDNFNKIMSTEKCCYCKCNLDYKNRTIDRLDNSVGYTNENCYACCLYCNRIKWSSNINDIKNIYFGMRKLMKTKKNHD